MPIKRGSWDRVIPHPPGVILLYGRWYRSSRGAILKNEGLRPDTKRDTLTQEGATPRGPLGGEYICTHNSTQRTSTFHLLTHQIRNSHKYVWMYFLALISKIYSAANGRNGWRENKSVSKTGFLPSPRSNPQPPFVAQSKVFAVKAKLPVVLCTMYMAGRAKTECKICKTVVMRREGATNRKTINPNSYNWSSHWSCKWRPAPTFRSH